MSKFVLSDFVIELDLHIFLWSPIGHFELGLERIIIELERIEILEHDGYTLICLQVICHSVHFKQSVGVILEVEGRFTFQVVDE